ncbi:MAG: aminotransferase class I/II-fold pyridoxal phosphate-dependent enzyme [candidate division WOR-3 bacterium]
MGFLREDISFSTPFTVSQKPYVAKLDQNESPYDIPEEIKEVLLEEIKRMSWNRYPQPAIYEEVKESFAKALGVKPENIALTFGGDQTILSAFWIAGGKGKRCIIYEPTYPMIRHYAAATSTDADIKVLGEEFFPNPSDFKGKDYNIIFFVSPNNPTGHLISKEVIKEALETGALVFVDEAYYPFSGITVWDDLKDYPNLMVGRSLSKSLLAGMRMGYVLASKEIIRAVDYMNFAPYNLTIFQLAIFKRFGDIMGFLKKATNEVVEERERVYKALEGLGFKPIKSYGNFIMFKVRDHERAYKVFVEEGIRIRDVSGLPGLSNHLRVTIGLNDENDKFIEVLKKLVPHLLPE